MKLEIREALDNLVVSVGSFHDRFGVRASRDDTLTHLYGRTNMLVEELGEYCQALNRGEDVDKILEKLVDILFVLIGTLDIAAAGDWPVAEAITAVVQKNNAKTRLTHAFGDNGTVTRIDQAKVADQVAWYDENADYAMGVSQFGAEGNHGVRSQKEIEEMSKAVADGAKATRAVTARSKETPCICPPLPDDWSDDCLLHGLHPLPCSVRRG